MWWFKGWFSVAHCFFQQKSWVLHTWYRFELEQLSMSFNEIAYLMEVQRLFKQEFPRVLHDELTRRSCMNFKCEVADVNIAIPIDFRAVKYFCGIWPTMLWWHFMIYLVICTTAISLGSSCMLFTTLGWLLSLSPADHSPQPLALKWDGGSVGLVSAKYLFWELKVFYSIKKIFIQNELNWNKIILR